MTPRSLSWKLVPGQYRESKNGLLLCYYCFGCVLRYIRVSVPRMFFSIVGFHPIPSFLVCLWRHLCRQSSSLEIAEEHFIRSCIILWCHSGMWCERTLVEKHIKKTENMQHFLCCKMQRHAEGAVASWLVRSSPDRAVRVRTLAGDIALCSWARHFTLTVPLSTQV